MTFQDLYMVIYGIYSDNFSDIYFDILYGIYSGFLSDIIEKDVTKTRSNLGSGTGYFERDSTQRRRTMFIGSISRMLLR